MGADWASSNIFLYVVVFTAHIGCFLNGTCVGWTSPILVKLNSLKDNPLGRTITTAEQSWLVAIGVFGNWMGAYLSVYLAKKYGRKPTMIIMSIPIFISYATLTVADSFLVIMLARTAAGFSTGGLFTVDPMYVGEVAEPSNRGLLGGAMNLFVNMGLLFSLCVGPYTSFFWFHVILAVCPAIYMILVLLIVVETPYYLIEKNKEKAEKVLQKLRGNDEVELEMLQIQEYVENQRKNNVKFLDMFKNRAAKRGLIMGCGLVLFQQCSGVGVIMTFGQLIFEEVGDFLPSDLSAIILGIAQVIFSMISPAFTDKLGRKILLIFSHVGMTSSLTVFGIYFLMKQYGYEVHQISWLPLAALVCFKFMYCAGSGPVPFVVIGEIFPQTIKALASSITCMASSGSTLLLSSAYPLLKSSIGIGYTFLLVAGVGIFAVLFVIFFVLETKGKSLQEIQEDLNKTKQKHINSRNV